MLHSIISQLSEGNPQLFRELKGKVNAKNLRITVLLSLAFQVMLYVYYLGLLPTRAGYNRYCVGQNPADYNDSYSNLVNNYCVKDLLGNWMIIKQLWWLDIFMAINFIAIFGLLIVGCYMLIANLAKEEAKGTLNFIRLSPQSAFSILGGKILGVPILLYIAAALVFPFHLFAGIAASIPVPLILAFDLVLIAACMFFYSVAILYALVSGALGGFQPWLGTGTLWLMLSITSSLGMEGSFLPQTPMKWLTLFYPGAVFPYIVESTFLPSTTVGYVDPQAFKNLSFYGFTLFEHAPIAIAFILLNFAVWTFWTWQGIDRRFHNPLKTVMSKRQSYVFCTTYVLTLLGFTQLEGKYEHEAIANFLILQFLLLGLFIILIGALSPLRQALIDWSSYRHQAAKRDRSLLKDLISGEKSPSVVAIAINVALTSVLVIGFIALNRSGPHTMAFILNQVINASLILIFAVLAQLLLLNSKKKSGIGATLFVGCLGILPLFPLSIFFNPQTTPVVWLFSLFSWMAIEKVTATTIFMSLLAQWGTFALLTLKMSKQLNSKGKSQTYALLSAKD